MVDPSKVKLPKELRKIKSKVAKETNPKSFTTTKKRLRSPRRVKNNMTNSLTELKVPGDSLATSARQTIKEKRAQSSNTRVKEATATFGGGMYSTAQESQTTKETKVPAMRNTIQGSNPQSRAGKLQSSTDVKKHQTTTIWSK